MTEYILGVESGADDELFTNIANMYSEVRSIGEEIVRCRDCKHYKHIEPDGFCAWAERKQSPDCFCAWAERKEGGDD